MSNMTSAVRLPVTQAATSAATEAVGADETLLFIGATAVGVNRDDDSEVALTFIQDLCPMHEVTAEEQFVPAFNNSQILLFLDELSEQGKIETVRWRHLSA